MSDIRLDRYENGQDAEYKAYVSEPQEESAELLHSTRAYLVIEIARIEKHLAEGDSDEYVTAEQWQERLTECRAQLGRIDTLLQRQKLIDEQSAIQGTIDLHCAGLIKCNTRYLEIESELKQMEVR